jgi:hypothetical protein
VPKPPTTIIMSLGSLPSEILIEIIKDIRRQKTPNPSVDGIYTPRGREALALCSKRLHELTTPSVYSSFNDVGRHLPLFLRTILRKPILATYVKRLFITAEADGYNNSDWVKQHFKEEDWRLLRAVLVEDLDDEDAADKSMLAIQAGRWDATIAALIPKLANLKSMTIYEYVGDQEDDESEYFSEMLDRLTTPSHNGRHDAVLSKLVKISVPNPANWRSATIQGMVKLIKFPSLVSFSCSSVNGYHWHMLDPYQFSIKELTLLNILFDDASFETFMRCCPQLEILSIQQDDLFNGNGFFSPKVFGRCLSHVKSTLKSLEIIRCYEERLAVPNKLGSLAGMEVLEFLSLPVDMAFQPEQEGDDMGINGKLPTTLISLELWNCSRRIWEEMDRLTADKTQRNLDLEFISFHFDDIFMSFRSEDDSTDEDSDRIGQLQLLEGLITDRCAEVGITVLVDREG